MNVLGLVQLCGETDSGRAGSAYCQCFGLEALARKHHLNSPDQLLTLVQGLLLAAIGPAEGVASGIAFRAARQGHLDDLPGVCNAMSSDRVPVEMRRASLQMGAALWEKSRQWEWAGSVHDQLDPLARTVELHHAVAFGALVAETTASQVRAIAACLLNTARSIIDSAVRAIPLDDIAAQRVLSSVQATIADLAARCVDKDPQSIVAVPLVAGIGPGYEIGRGFS